MTAILIDNEPECNEVLHSLLNIHCPVVQVVAKCTSGAEGIAKIRALKPDLVFLDIEMEYMSGLDMLLKLQPIDFEVVFVTGYNQYMQQAIRLSALDYINKPPVSDDIIAAVFRASQNYHKKELSKRYEIFFNTMVRRQNNQKPGRIALTTNIHTIEYIDLHHILWVAAGRAYTTFHLCDTRKITVTGALSTYEEILDDSFMRIHRSFLINLDQVRFYHKQDEQVELNNGLKLPVSKNEKEKLLKRLSKY